MEVKPASGGRIVSEVIDPLPVEGRGTTDDAVYLVAFFEEQLREI
jgi:hypothetical protein